MKELQWLSKISKIDTHVYDETMISSDIRFDDFVTDYFEFIKKAIAESKDKRHHTEQSEAESRRRQGNVSEKCGTIPPESTEIIRCFLSFFSYQIFNHGRHCINERTTLLLGEFEISVRSADTKAKCLENKN